MSENKVFVPPLKIQGIKTKLVPFISSNVILHHNTTWIEPFMGSGVVGFNIAPRNAIFADINPHIIEFYSQMKSGKINHFIVKEFLEENGALLSQKDDEYFYEVRERFNNHHSPLDFLFLNRSCFNGMIRFNKDFKYNVPYGHKPLRFSKAYITKIVNQVLHIEFLIKNNNWLFVCQSYEKTIENAPSNSFIYCDPPYIGRHVDYYDSWDENSELMLKKKLFDSGANFMVSTWDHNEFRTNSYISTVWSDCNKLTTSHFYHVGASEKNRLPMTEALLMNYFPDAKKSPYRSNSQTSFFQTQ